MKVKMTCRLKCEWEIQNCENLSVWLVVSFGPGLPFPGQKPGDLTVSYSEAEESFPEGEEGTTEKATRRAEQERCPEVEPVARE